MSLQGKVALVTGASSGLGRAVALRLGADGARVVVSYGSDASGASEVVKEIGADNAQAIQADAAKTEDLGRLVDETVSRFGKIDILVAAAGVMDMGPLEVLTEGAFDRIFNINVKAPLFLCQVRLCFIFFVLFFFYFIFLGCSCRDATPFL